MSARELLETYGDELNPRAMPPLHRDAAAPKAFDAVRAVLKLHAPTGRGAGGTCAGCATDVTFTYWPCKTVRAIEEALKP